MPTTRTGPYIAGAIRQITIYRPYTRSQRRGWWHRLLIRLAR